MDIKPSFVFLVLITFFFNIMLSLSLHAEIYKWTDKDGNLHFGNKPPTEQKSEAVEIKINTVTIPAVTTIPGSVNSPSAGTSKRVVMYSTSWCGYCKKARNFMRKNHIPFTEYDIEKSTRAKRAYDRLNGNGVPLIIVGNKRMSGFSPSKLLALLK